MSLALLVFAAPDTFADTVKVTVDRALVWSRPSGAAVIITQLLRDDTVEVVRKVGGWYEILVPTGTLGVEFRSGFVNASQVVIASVGPPSAQAIAALTPPPPPARPRTLGTSFLNIDGLKRRGKDSLTQTASNFSSVLGEDTTITANYGESSGWSFGMLAGGAVWHWIGIGFGFDVHRSNRPAVIDAIVPHPFFFNEPRQASFTTAPLPSKETVFHFPAVFVPPAFGPLKVLAFAGPSAFSVSQIVVTDITLNEQYPYDTVSISGVTTVERKGTAVGYHAGADVSVFFTRSVGAGVGIRYSRANIKKLDADTAATSGVAGGTSVVAGVRFKF